MTQPLTGQQLAARYERLADTATHALHALGYLIEDHSDPGADALGAQYNLRQELLWHTMREEPAEAVDAVAQHERRKAVAAEFARLDAHDWGYDHGFCDEYGTDPETDAFVDAALAVVQPELDRLRAELEQSRQQLDEARERLANYGTPLRGPVAAPPIDQSDEVRQAQRALLESGAVPEQYAWVVGKVICPEGAKCPAGITAIFNPTKRGRLPVHRSDYGIQACPGSGQKATPLKLAAPAALPSA
jgi:hypothetical protein